MRTVAIITNGGDTASLNAGIDSIRRNAIAAGYPRVLGFTDGFHGVRTKAVRLLTQDPIDPNIGGTTLRSLRYAPKTDRQMKEIYDALKILEVDALVVIGGDGSLSATRDLTSWPKASKYSVRILGYPRTIDNDISTNTYLGSTEVALCTGFPSAAAKIAKVAKDLRVTARSTQRIFTLETMGRNAGWLAAAACIGGAEFALIPEVELNKDDWDRFFDRVIELYNLHGHLIEQSRRDSKSMVRSKEWLPLEIESLEEWAFALHN